MAKRSDDDRPDFVDLSGRVYRLCLAVLGDESDARDAAQEAFVRAWARKGRKRRDVAWWTWLAGFAVRTCREVRRRKLSAAGGEPDGGETTSAGASVGFAQGDDARQDELLRGLARLPNRQREVTILRFIMGMSIRETAETLGCPPGTVKSNLARAFAGLRTALQERVPGEMRGF